MYNILLLPIKTKYVPVQTKYLPTKTTIYWLILNIYQ
jgi:hypothetical protein